MALVVGLDVGTQGAKALVYDAESRQVVARGAAKYDIIKSSVPGRAEQHPSTWIEGSATAIGAALAAVDSSKVKAIGISGQQHGLVPLDADGKVIRNAKLWCDVESAAEAANLSQQWGITLVPGFTASKLAWLKKNEPGNWARLRHVLLPHDYLNHFLTSRFVMECGDASGTGVFDTAARAWDSERMRCIDPGLEDFFPQLTGPDQAIGELTPAAAAALGLPAGLLVAPGSGDNQMSALGAGAVAQGAFVASLGTSGTLFGASRAPVVDPSGSIAPFCDATGQWLPLLCTMNCTLVPEEVRRAFGLDFAEATALAEREAPGCEGVNFVPYLTGERTPNWPHASGAVAGLRPGSLRPGLLYRAALEAATFSLLSGLKLMEGYGMSAVELRVVGGGSKNPLWRRIIADAFQLPLRFPAEAESAALGAALQAAAILQGVPVRQYVSDNPPPCEPVTLQPNLDNREAMAAAFLRHAELGETLFGAKG